MNYPDLFLFVAGHWRDREGRDGRPVINPATGSAVAELPLATPADLDEACQAAADSFGRATTIEQASRSARPPGFPSRSRYSRNSPSGSPRRSAGCGWVTAWIPRRPSGRSPTTGGVKDGGYGSEGIEDYLFAKLVSEA